MGKSQLPGVAGTSALPGELVDGTLTLLESPIPKVQNGRGAETVGAYLSDEEILLAAVAYGEASERNVYEELAGIANVLARQRQARKFTSMAQFMERDKSFAYAASDGNVRYSQFIKASPEARAKNAGMAAALMAARNALSARGEDYSNGAYFWDGRDLAKNPNHEKRKQGLKFTLTTHDIFGIGDQLRKSPVIRYWIHNGKPTRERGRYQWVYESTAAWGDTIFWRLNPAYLAAEGGTEHGN
jgi:hypothetical protein